MQMLSFMEALFGFVNQPLLLPVLTVGQRMPMMRGPPMAPPMPRPPPPPPMMMPPSMQGPSPQGAPQPLQHMAAPPQVSTLPINPNDTVLFLSVNTIAYCFPHGVKL